MVVARAVLPRRLLPVMTRLSLKQIDCKTRWITMNHTLCRKHSHKDVLFIQVRHGAIVLDADLGPLLTIGVSWHFGLIRHDQCSLFDLWPLELAQPLYHLLGIVRRDDLGLSQRPRCLEQRQDLVLVFHQSRLEVRTLRLFDLSYLS